MEYTKEQNVRYRRYLDDSKFHYMVDIITRSIFEDKVNLSDWEQALLFIKEAKMK